MSTVQIHPSAIVDQPCEIGANTRVWHFSHIMANSIIGENCNLGQNVVISSGVILGNNVKVQNNVSIYTGVICEDDVFVGPSVVFSNVINPRSAISRKDAFQSTLVKKGATIGANATIICGHLIGEFAMIGAGAVVTRDVRPYSLVLGNPAKQVGWVSEYGNKLDFGRDNLAVCAESGQQYELSIDSVKRIS